MEQFQRLYTPLLRYIIAPILTDERDREECLSDVLLRVWDAIFLDLIWRDVPFFSLKVRYEGDRLAEAVLNGEKIK